ncbi:MAG: hypothetical protein K0U70_09425 [Actinomycetia bacterium]|nr:hypothetical protein [Actinomycetes bacterium]MCH9768003.1 hypothetical protein [Actinomycetes bacterium]
MQGQPTVTTPHPALNCRVVPPPQSGKFETSTIRNEFKYDLFRSDLPEIMRSIEREHDEIERPAPTTLTLFFYSSRLGAPEVETRLRLRAYGHVDDPTAVTLDELATMSWRIEKKHGQIKEHLGTITKLPKSVAADDEAWDIAGMILRPNLLKVTQRRHFALTPNHDESHRLTVDLSRNVFKFSGPLQHLGDMGPRVEVKLPANKQEDLVPLTSQLRNIGHWTPYAGLASYFHFLLRHQIPAETHLSLPEIEAKHAISSVIPVEVFDRLNGWLHTKRDQWRLLLPYPHTITRVRRYHVCKSILPDSSATVVETAAGRCSLKVKDNAQQHGSLLLRDTSASHETDLTGAVMFADAFIRAHGLAKLNEFTKIQRKIPIALANGHSFQFSLDQCTDPAGRQLAQIEIEYIGSTDGRVPSTGQVLNEMDDIATELRSSPLGPSLERTHLAKHAFFSTRVAP